MSISTGLYPNLDL